MKTISIKGKEYTPVNERILEFNKQYPKGCIQTKLISEPTSKNLIVKAIITPNIEVPTRFFSSYAQEVIGDSFINKTSALENADTSAVGRALGMMGIGILESVASADEVNKSLNATKPAYKLATPAKVPMRPKGATYDKPLCSLCKSEKIWRGSFWGCPHFSTEKGQKSYDDWGIKKEDIPTINVDEPPMPTEEINTDDIQLDK